LYLTRISTVVFCLYQTRSEELNKEVHGQIAQLRAQLLRSEQEMQLMRTKLEEEKTEREKAQKQVCLSYLGSFEPYHCTQRS
jgi:molecular chaperone GrpE (heat shock protein)